MVEALEPLPEGLLGEGALQRLKAQATIPAHPHTRFPLLGSSAAPLPLPVASVPCLSFLFLLPLLQTLPRSSRHTCPKASLTYNSRRSQVSEPSRKSLVRKPLNAETHLEARHFAAVRKKYLKNSGESLEFVCRTLKHMYWLSRPLNTSVNLTLSPRQAEPNDRLECLAN